MIMHVWRLALSPYPVLAAAFVLLHSALALAVEAAADDTGMAPAQVAVSGIVNDVEDSVYRLRYGSGEISVALDRPKRFRQAGRPPVVGIGESVTVTGPADEAFFGARRLRAQTVYVEDRDMFYTTSWSPDGEPWEIRAMPVAPLYGGGKISIGLAGRVVGVNGREFSLQVGGTAVRIGTGEMMDSPLDASGSPALEIGDWVQVGGTLDEAFFRDRRLEALRVTRIIGDEPDAS